MPPRRTLSTRWVTAILAAALACSVAVVWSLIQLTGGTSASSATPEVSASDSASAGPPASSASSTSISPAPPTRGQDGTATGSPSGVTGVQRSAVLPTSTPIVLPGSDLTLPAAWTGTAELSITVLGRCAKSVGTSSYTREAELALQRPATGSGPIGDANPLSLTVGITPADVPGLSLYSASTRADGMARRTWWLATGASVPTDRSGRTELSGVLIDDRPLNGVLPPNLLVDSETDLQPCESSGGMVKVPRILAAGSTLAGWVSPDAGHLELKATTTDGERAVSAVITLSRRSGT